MCLHSFLFCLKPYLKFSHFAGNDGQEPEGLKIGQNGDCRGAADKVVIVMLVLVGFMLG